MDVCCGKLHLIWKQIRVVHCRIRNMPQSYIFIGKRNECIYHHKQQLGYLISVLR
jgi:hypothetical protein